MTTVSWTMQEKVSINLCPDLEEANRIRALKFVSKFMSQKVAKLDL